MSATVKRSIMTFVASMLMAAFSTVFAITMARLIRQHRAEGHGDLAATDPRPAADDAPES